MKVVIQKVKSASVDVEQKLISEINQGYLALVGIHESDTQDDIDYITKKILNLRLFESENGYFDKSIKDIEGQILFVSQFTLYGDTKKGNRPSFFKAMPPEKAKLFYENFLENFKTLYPKIKDGLFGANMQVSLINDGPITIILDSDK
jgi:D-aminoacyl-tRNA deacylase